MERFERSKQVIMPGVGAFSGRMPRNRITSSKTRAQLLAEHVSDRLNKPGFVRRFDAPTKNANDLWVFPAGDRQSARHDVESRAAAEEGVAEMQHAARAADPGAVLPAGGILGGAGGGGGGGRGAFREPPPIVRERGPRVGFEMGAGGVGPPGGGLGEFGRFRAKEQQVIGAADEPSVTIGQLLGIRPLDEFRRPLMPRRDQLRTEVDAVLDQPRRPWYRPIMDFTGISLFT